MAAETGVASLSNPLATIPQLTTSASALDGLPADLIGSVRYSGSLLTQAAGILLRLPQETIARALITFARFYTGPEGGSFREYAIKVWRCLDCSCFNLPDSHIVASGKRNPDSPTRVSALLFVDLVGAALTFS